MAVTTNRQTDMRTAGDSLVVHALPSPRHGQLRWPTVTRFDDGWIVAANVFYRSLDRKIGPRALYLAHSHRGMMPLPDGDFLFAYPLVLSSPDNSLHLFWVEGVPSSTPDAWPQTFTELWHARFADGRWAKAELVLRAKYLSWESRAPQAAIDSKGRLHVAVLADTGGPSEIFYLKRDSMGWTRRGTGLHGIYPAIASLPGSGLLLALVMSEGGPPGLFTTWSTDLGASWAKPSQVRGVTDSFDVHQPQLRIAGSAAYLGWIESRDGQHERWNFSRREPAIDGVADAWTAPVRSPRIEGTVLSVTFAATGCGYVRALAEHLTSGAEPTVTELQFRDNQAPLLAPLAAPPAIAPVIDRFGDRVIQLWSGLGVKRDSLRPYYREFSACR